MLLRICLRMTQTGQVVHFSGLGNRMGLLDLVPNDRWDLGQEKKTRQEI